MPTEQSLKRTVFRREVACPSTHRPCYLQERHSKHTGLDLDVIESRRKRELESCSVAKGNDADPKEAKQPRRFKSECVRENQALELANLISYSYLTILDYSGHESAKVAGTVPIGGGGTERETGEI